MVKRPKKVNSWRSGLEKGISEQLTSLGVPFEYESFKIEYLINETRKYTQDFKLPNGIIIESKGYFDTADRKKHLLIKEQYPELDIRFVFTRATTKITKNSKTSYGDWCDKHGFKWAVKFIPEGWLHEVP